LHFSSLSHSRVFIFGINRSTTLQACLWKGPDSGKWKDGEDGIFSVKTAYNALQSNVEEEENKELKILWNTRVTPKA